MIKRAVLDHVARTYIEKGIRDVCCARVQIHEMYAEVAKELKRAEGSNKETASYVPTCAKVCKVVKKCEKLQETLVKHPLSVVQGM